MLNIQSSKLIVLYNGATDKPCGGGLSTLTQNRFQTIHEERNVPDSFYLCSETFYL